RRILRIPYRIPTWDALRERRPPWGGAWRAAGRGRRFPPPDPFPSPRSDYDGGTLLDPRLRLRPPLGGGRRVRRPRAEGAARAGSPGGVRDGGALPDVSRAGPPRGSMGLGAMARLHRRGGGLALHGRHRRLLGEPLPPLADGGALARRHYAARRSRV